MARPRGQEKKGWEEFWEGKERKEKGEEERKEFGGRRLAAAGRSSGVVEVIAAQRIDESSRSLERDGLRLRSGVGAGGEGVVTGVEHAVGVIGGVGARRDVEVTQHGIRFPAPEELDGVGIDAGAQEGGGAAGA